MALEQEGQNRNTNGVVDAGDEGGKAPRLPRWTRQEILVLIQGKRDAENKFRRGRTAGLPFGSGQVEPKWASVSSYCRKHGVNRGPVQCRKRWSNLAGDYKKIKEWESQIREETESFWVMRNDLRRERKLPGFFDKEVYDILDSPAALALALSSSSPPPPTTTKTITLPAEEPLPHLYDSNRSAPGDGEDGLFSDFEQDEVAASSKKNKDIPAPIPISEKLYQPLLRRCQAEDVTNEKQSTSNPEMGSTSQGERKRKRLATDGEEETLQYQLIDVLERNGKMLSAQLEAQNINFQLDREQRKDHASNLVAVLDKLADALGRIADKL
ncbi:hypothetical protein JHK82_029617 [Glycine max]|uniref:Myb-like domain-containing protein n=1 Tax=Glycine max TaxID=3847 RepID=I1LFM1_SOYBN|nr:trihelix transcription factor ASR3 [Glycine max]XP_040861974.1 trihelix transcription factor ASR3 [Glycine max]KAG5005594.1 hypothetical protein JHK86_029733 [Glycine max]KAG5128782.1 hypothetical protein JHK82_029617 [Glycine max]KAG5153389.1 hypothetical protein JHK84_029861 [Glycine max]KAH1140766.1 hypothetical protein GYH30_029567 [Glycine max]KAH1231431.1 Trihelix transcription factor ASR3 [Glycine max]|eukprot:XP_003536818.1 trihelix transcription factor ASR3 [Glycine max]